MASLAPLAVLALLVPSASYAASIAAPGVIGGPDAGPATPNPVAIYYNPAAIAAAPGVQVLLDAQDAFIRLDVTATRNGGIDPQSGEPYNVAKARVQVPVLFAGATWQIVPKRLTVGFGVTDAFIGGGDYSAGEPNADAPPYESNQRYAGIVTKIVTFHLIPAVGVTLVDGVHVGASFKYILDSFYALQAGSPFGEAAVGADGPYTGDTLLEGTMSGGHIGWAGGVFIDRWKLAQVGLSYTNNGTISTSGSGTLTVPASLGGGSPTAELTLSAPLPPVMEAWVNSQVSDTVMVGLGAEMQMWGACCSDHGGDIVIGVESEDGDAIGVDPEDNVATTVAETNYAPRRLHNTVDVAANVGWQMNKAWWFGARADINQSAVPDYAVSATNIDFNNVGGVLAARYTVGKLTFGLSYSKFFTATREITDSAYNAAQGSTDYKDQYFTTSLPYQVSANGEYKAQVDIVGVRVGTKF